MKKLLFLIVLVVGVGYYFYNSSEQIENSEAITDDDEGSESPEVKKMIQKKSFGESISKIMVSKEEAHSDASKTAESTPRPLEEKNSRDLAQENNQEDANDEDKNNSPVIFEPGQRFEELGKELLAAQTKRARLEEINILKTEISRDEESVLSTGINPEQRAAIQAMLDQKKDKLNELLNIEEGKGQNK